MADLLIILTLLVIAAFFWQLRRMAEQSQFCRKSMPKTKCAAANYATDLLDPVLVAIQVYVGKFNTNLNLALMGSINIKAVLI